MTLQVRTDDIIIIMGMGGSGKSTFARELVKGIRKHRIYDTSRNQYKGLTNYVPKDYNAEEFERWCDRIIERGDVFALIEEGQNYIGKSWGHTTTSSLRMVKEGRNTGIGTGVVTRRPQDLSTKLLDDADHMFIFKLVGLARDYMIKYLDLEKEDVELLRSMKDWKSKVDHCFLHYHDGVLRRCPALVI